MNAWKFHNIFYEPSDKFICKRIILTSGLALGRLYRFHAMGPALTRDPLRLSEFRALVIFKNTRNENQISLEKNSVDQHLHRIHTEETDYKNVFF